MSRKPPGANQMAFDFDALFAPQPSVPDAVKEAVKDAVFSFRETVKPPTQDAPDKPWAERLQESEDKTARILEIDGIRAICTPDRWMCFYAIDPGKPFISETGFMSGCSSRKGSSEETFAALLAERRKQHKGKLPIPATTYRLPEPGEDGPQAATGALLALKQLKTDPYNAALLIEANSQWGDGTCSEHGKPERLRECTKALLPPASMSRSIPTGMVSPSKPRTGADGRRQEPTSRPCTTFAAPSRAKPVTMPRPTHPSSTLQFPSRLNDRSTMTTDTTINLAIALPKTRDKIPAEEA